MLVGYAATKDDEADADACNHRWHVTGDLRGCHRPARPILSQATEAGTLYRPDEVAAIAEVARSKDLGLRHPVETNELFAALPEALAEGLEAAGFQFYRWPTREPGLAEIRLVTAFNTSEAEVEAFLAALRRLAEAPLRSAG